MCSMNFNLTICSSTLSQWSSSGRFTDLLGLPVARNDDAEGARAAKQHAVVVACCAGRRVTGLSEVGGSAAVAGPFEALRWLSGEI